MIEILEKYLAAPTYKNAAKVRSYAAKHPMVSCLLSDGYSDVLKNALRHAKVGHD